MQSLRARGQMMKVKSRRFSQLYGRDKHHLCFSMHTVPLLCYSTVTNTSHSFIIMIVNMAEVVTDLSQMCSPDNVVEGLCLCVGGQMKC